MKKFLRFNILLLLAGFIAAGCSKDDDDNGGTTTSTTTDPGVIINGVKWATRNVDTPGTFAATPESAGMFYQWNRKTAWPATGDVTGWDSTIPTSDTWVAAKDPSPAGWRVPTYAEIQSLVNTTYVTSKWTAQNGIVGRKFTDKATGASIFLPAAGSRYGTLGTLNGAGTSGSYWSSAQYDRFDAYNLHFNGSGAGTDYSGRGDGFSVRCVKAE